MDAVKLSGAAAMLAEAWAGLAPHLLADAPPQPPVVGPGRQPEPNVLPVLAWLPDLVPFAAAETLQLAGMLVAAGHGLAWCQTYSQDAVEPAFLAR
jgi:hypothetical protein